MRRLAEHLDDYAAHLTQKGDAPDHVKLTLARVRALFDGCEFVLVGEVDAGRAAEWLTALRQPTWSVAIPAGKTEFTPREVSDLFGISGTALRATIMRYGLAATGQGMARKYPRTTVEAVADRVGRGCGPQTVNHYIRAIRGFFRWLVRAKRIGSNPLETLTLLNTQTDVRRGRRELSAEELRNLFAVTKASERSFRGLTGEDRYHLYLTAATTGFRASAFASLTRTDLNLAADGATVTLAARFNKSRKPKVQPLPADVAEELKAYLKAKSKGQPVWGGTWARDHRGAEMIRGDLEAAGIAYSRSEEHTSELQSLRHLVCRLLLEKKKKKETLEILT